MSADGEISRNESHRDEDSRVVLGRIRGAHGVRGSLRVQPFTEERNALLAFDSWLLGVKGHSGDDWQEFSLRSGHVHGSELLVKLAGGNSPERTPEAGGSGRA